MIVGVPREIRDNESRVGITPSVVEALVRTGYRVVIDP